MTRYRICYKHLHTNQITKTQMRFRFLSDAQRECTLMNNKPTDPYFYWIEEVKENKDDKIQSNLRLVQ